MSRAVSGYLGIFGPGTLVVRSGRTSWDILGYPGISRVVQGILGIFGPATLVVPFGRTFPVVPGLFEIFRLGTLVVMFCGSPGQVSILPILSL